MRYHGGGPCSTVASYGHFEADSTLNSIKKLKQLKTPNSLMRNVDILLLCCLPSFAAFSSPRSAGLIGPAGPPLRRRLPVYAGVISTSFALRSGLLTT